MGGPNHWSCVGKINLCVDSDYFSSGCGVGLNSIPPPSDTLACWTNRGFETLMSVCPSPFSTGSHLGEPFFLSHLVKAGFLNVWYILWAAVETGEDGCPRKGTTCKSSITGTFGSLPKIGMQEILKLSYLRNCSIISSAVWGLARLKWMCILLYSLSLCPLNYRFDQVC